MWIGKQNSKFEKFAKANANNRSHAVYSVGSINSHRSLMRSQWWQDTIVPKTHKIIFCMQNARYGISEHESNQKGV